MECPACAEPAIPDTNYCRKCGHSLVMRDPEMTSAITRRMKPTFPASGSQVVSQEERTRKLSDRAPKHVLPEDPLPFTIRPNQFGKRFMEVFESRGLLSLKMSYIRKGSGNVLREGQEFVPDKKIKCKHIELMFAKNKAFEGDWDLQKDNKVMIRFGEIEKVYLVRHLLGRTFIIMLKPEKKVRLLDLDPITRKLRLRISRVDTGLARELEMAVMSEISPTKRKKRLKAEPRLMFYR